MWPYVYYLHTLIQILPVSVTHNGCAFVYVHKKSYKERNSTFSKGNHTRTLSEMTTFLRNRHNILFCYRDLLDRIEAPTCKLYSCSGQQFLPMTITLDVGSCSKWHHKVCGYRVQDRARKINFHTLLTWEHPWQGIMPLVFVPATKEEGEWIRKGKNHK